MMSHLRRLLPLHRLGELNVPAFNKSVCGCIVAIVGQEVVVELPEHVEGDPAIGRKHVVVGLPEHVVELVEGQVLRQQLMGEAVHPGQTVQLHNSCYVASLKSEHGISVLTFDQDSCQQMVEI